MKALTFTQYGNVSNLHLTEGLPIPKLADDEVLIEVKASSINKGDWHYVIGDPFPVRFVAGGLFKPRYNIPGVDASGVIHRVGNSVSELKVGDNVIADLTFDHFGGWAEYTTCKVKTLAHMPLGISFKQAATIPVSGVTALQAVRDHGQVEPGKSVLVNGATGGVGMYAVLLSKYMGAEVSAVGSSMKGDMLNSLSADHVIYYDTEDFVKNGKRYDVIIDTAAYRPFSVMKDSLTNTGRYIMVGGGFGQFGRILFLGPIFSSKTGRTYKNFLCKPNGEDIAYIADLIVQGHVEPVIDRTWPFHEAVQALQMFEERRVKGKYVLEINL